MKEYQLKLKNPFINPFWLNSVKGAEIKSIVENNEIIINNESLKFVDDQIENGESVIVYLRNNFIAVKESDLIQEEKNRLIKKENEKLLAKQQLDNLIKETEEFNNNLNIPIKWHSGIKDVLSGLTINSNGDGRNKSTVNHVVLDDDLKDGRLKRKKGDFLCSKDDKGKQWSGVNESYYIDNDGKRVNAQVSCKQCLKICQKWNKKPKFKL